MIQRLSKTSTVLTLLVVAAAAGCFLAMRATAQIAPDNGLAAIQVRMAQLENRLQKARAIRDIKRLQYSYAHYAELGLWLDLGDLFATDGIAHYAQGDFRGPESLRKFYLQELGRGQLGLAEKFNRSIITRESSRITNWAGRRTQSQPRDLIPSFRRIDLRRKSTKHIQRCTTRDSITPIR